MIPSLWHDVIHRTYLKQKSVVDWFRDARKCFKGVSNCWKAIYSFLHIFSDWIVWKQGNGWEICLGIYPLVEAQSYFKLSLDIL